MIASKHEEVAFIHTDTIIKNIAYGKFSLDELLEAELYVLNTIDFRTDFPTVYQASRVLFPLLEFNSKKTKLFFENSTLLI